MIEKDVSTALNPLETPVIRLFFHYFIPSFLGLIAISSASLVDGMFLGNWVGAEALAAINLVIPYFSVVFGIVLMLSVGGSVRAARYFGEGNLEAATAVFNKVMAALTLFSAVVVALTLLYVEKVATALGAPATLVPMVVDYLLVLLPFLFLSMVAIGLYYFVRADGFPKLASAAMIGMAITNIVLDAWFIGGLGWGIAGAAWATGISYVVQLVVLLGYMPNQKRRLRFMKVKSGWREVMTASFNGISEFVNEASAGIVLFIINWLLVTRYGVTGVAAFTVVNYLLFFGLMFYYSVGDALMPLLSNNLGAGKSQRIQKLLYVGFATTITAGALLVSALLIYPEYMIELFLEVDTDGRSNEVVGLAKDFVFIVWPVIFLSGLNMVISAYFTAMHKPVASGTVALLRGLILPVGLLALIWWFLPENEPLLALPIGEIITLVVAGILFLRNRPSAVLKEGVD